MILFVLFVCVWLALYVTGWVFKLSSVTRLFVFESFWYKNGPIVLQRVCRFWKTSLFKVKTAVVAIFDHLLEKLGYFLVQNLVTLTGLQEREIERVKTGAKRTNVKVFNTDRIDFVTFAFDLLNNPFCRQNNLSECHSVTRFDEISLIWQKFTSLATF